MCSVEAACRAAVRETCEEAGLRIDGSRLTVLSHWTPGPEAPKRFLTWLLFGQVDSTATVTIDNHEIVEHRWITPAAALEQHRLGQIDLLPPTWMTLHQLSGYSNLADAEAGIGSAEATHYVSHIARAGGSTVILWDGDAGYATRDSQAPGPRHRLYLETSGWRYERSI